MKAAKIKKKDIIEKELEKNIDLISEVKTKEKIKYNILQKEEETEEKRIAAKNLFMKKNSKKMDIESNDGEEDFE